MSFNSSFLSLAIDIDELEFVWIWGVASIEMAVARAMNPDHLEKDIKEADSSCLDETLKFHSAFASPSLHKIWIQHERKGIVIW